jgi:hypothetical protein
MIPVLTKVFQRYLETPFELFTDKYIIARGIFYLVDENKDLSKYFKEIDVIESETHPDVKVSLYKLDRVVNAEKGMTLHVEQKFRFLNSDNKTIELTERQIQHYLCIALRRVNEIVMFIMKDYKVEMSMNPEQDADTGGFFGDTK